jgi:hypothetical protein
MLLKRRNLLEQCALTGSRINTAQRFQRLNHGNQFPNRGD